MFKSPTSVHELPFHVSDLPPAELDSYPPTAKAAVLLTPAPAKSLLAVFKLFTSVQLEPFQVSVFAVLLPPGSSPPKATAFVLPDPAPVKSFFA